jgi:hypothetical protein
MALVPSLGSAGLALATSLAYAVAACISGYMQRHQIAQHVGEWAGVLGKSLVLVGAPTLAGYAVIALLAPGQVALKNLVAVVAIAAGSVVLVWGGRRWGISQMRDLLAFIPIRRRTQ